LVFSLPGASIRRQPVPLVLFLVVVVVVVEARAVVPAEPLPVPQPFMMDYSHAAYFSGSQPYQFIGIPPLTPSHSNSAASEEFNTTSPPVSSLPALLV